MDYMYIGIDDASRFNVDHSGSESESESDDLIVGFPELTSEHGESGLEDSVHSKSEESVDSESEESVDSKSVESVASKSGPSYLSVAVDSLDEVPPCVAKLRQELQGDYKPPAKPAEQALKARVLE